MAKKPDVTMDDLALMIQKGFEAEHEEHVKIRSEMATRKEMAEGFAKGDREHASIRKEMKDGFKRNDRDHNLIRKEMAAGFAKNDREHEVMMDDILWLKRELVDNRHKIHGLIDKKFATALLKRVDRIEAHLGFATPAHS